MKRIITTLLVALLALVSLCSCGKSGAQAGGAGIKPGSYEVFLTLSGGSGRAKIDEYSTLSVNEDKTASLTVRWSSKNYDYMIIEGEKILPVDTTEVSVFEVPLAEAVFGEPITVIGDTTAMGTPHEIEYEITMYLIENGEITGFDENALPENDKTEGSVSINAVQLTSDGKIKDYPTASPLKYESSMELSYASRFAVDYFDGGYALISMSGEGEYLLIPEGKEDVPDFEPEAKRINLPISKMYVVGTGSMDFFNACGTLDKVKFSSLDAKDWYLDEVKKRVESKEIIYAGKYSAPDYELLFDGGCDLVIENTMIYHSPAIREQLESLGFTTMVDLSSHEDNVMARMEWVKLYGLLTGAYDKAESAFKTQISKIPSEINKDAGLPSVGFFALNSTGTVNVRKTGDYVIDMIDRAGGTYAFSDSGIPDGTGTTRMELESFYLAAKDADFLVYNATIAGEINSMDELLSKCSVLSNCKAVKEGKVYCTSSNLYQSVMELGDAIKDFETMINGGSEFTYLKKVE
ncbi:MAG: ABC transporter substrate-binding protein [Lachnospiraceae bacterium]|nr:ABC transporter substrate-binding protein [Lachnospiraceae bacterium]